MSQLIGERYGVVRELGRGGVGQVVLAEDRQLGRQVAIKTLLSQDDRSRARFVEEAQVTGQLAHPNIVPIHGLDVDGKLVYLVMKRVEGRELKDVVQALAGGDRKAKREYGVRHLLRLFLQVCDAIGYAHSRGVIHRDLKPANVMVTPDDDVLVLDWGLAKPVASQAAGTSSEGAIRSRIRELESQDAGASADLTMDGAVVGTPAYMPPEQADGGVALDLRADVYSLGAILYELLTWRPPYSGGAYQVLSRLLQKGPPPPRKVAPKREIPPALESIVLCAMARDREDRYANAGELAEDIQRYLDGQKVLAHDETLREQIDRLVELHRTALQATAAGFLILVTLLVGATVIVRGKQQELEAAEAEVHAAQDEVDTELEARRVAAQSLEQLSRGEEVATQALRQVVAFEQGAPRSLPLSHRVWDKKDPTVLASSGPSPVDVLKELYAAARRDLDRSLADLAAAVPEGAIADEFAAKLASYRVRLDRTYAELLLQRAPSRFADVAASLNLGAEASILAARAALRRDDPAGARAALAGAKPPAGSPEEAAAEAIRLRVAGRRLDERRSAWDRAIERNPAAHWLYLRRAECWAMQGDVDRAVEDFEVAATLQPIDPWVHSARMARTHSVASETVNGSIAEFVLSLSFENMEAHWVTTRSNLWARGNLDGLIASARTWQKRGSLTPLQAEVWIADGALLVDSLDVAEEAARKILAEDPQNVAGRGCLAETVLRRGDLPGCLAITEPALRDAPGDGRLNRAHGEALLRTGRPREAIPYLVEGARGEITSEPWRVLGEAYLACGEPADLRRGIEAVEKGLSYDQLAAYVYGGRGTTARPPPRDARLQRLLGHLYRKLGELPAAAFHYGRAYVWWTNQAHLRWWQGRPIELEDALYLGEVHEQMGLQAEAAQCYSWAVEDPKVGQEAKRRLSRLTGGR